MAKFEIVMPKLGESIIQATIIHWLKAVGETIHEDDSIVDIATDKVDSEIPSPVEGILTKVFYEEGDIVPVGKVIAIIETGIDGINENNNEEVSPRESETEVSPTQERLIITKEPASARFYSPLVKTIAGKENVTVAELDSIQGSGSGGRVNKNDLLNYIKSKTEKQATPVTAASTVAIPASVAGTGDQIVEMDRIRRLIADHMVMSKQVSPHVTSFIEADVTNIVNWRNRVKDGFQKRENEKFTFMPVFVEAAAKALIDFPGVNASVEEHSIILRKNINIGMATSLPNGNLIVPVIKNADQKNLRGLALTVNDLANRARQNKLLPDEIQGGTFTITNLGTFGSITGTPIINQPQVAILGLGVIQKKPVVLETLQGDVIAIRHRIILSLTYDHRAVDGALGGMYLQRITKYLEEFDIRQTI